MARKPRGEGSLDQAAWVKAARDALKKGGISAVRVEVLARTLGVTPGSFYWHFKNRPSLFEAVLADWREANMRPFVAILSADLTPEQHLIDLALSWISGRDFDPAYDSAIRDWARTSTKVAQILRETDQQRIEMMTSVLRDYGIEGDEAFIRARVMYFHQVGYYALNISEGQTQRIGLFPRYFSAIVGKPLTSYGQAYLAEKRHGSSARTVAAVPA